MEKKFYAICHKHDGVDGSWVSVGLTIVADDAETLVDYLQTKKWSNRNRPTIGRLYRSDTEELVKEFAI